MRHGPGIRPTHSLEVLPDAALETATELLEGVRCAYYAQAHPGPLMLPASQGFFPASQGVFPVSQGVFPASQGFAASQGFLNHISIVREVPQIGIQGIA